MTKADPQPDGTALIHNDPWLEPHRAHLAERYAYLQSQRRLLHGELTGEISQGHHYFGFNRGRRADKPGVWYREWAPHALQLRLIGDFNQWDRHANPCVRDQWGVWSIFLPDDEYADRLTHGSFVKVHVVAEHETMDRIPAYIRRTVQVKEAGYQYIGQYWNPPETYQWQHDVPKLSGALRIYEAHVGMAQEEPRIGSYMEFAQHILPRIAKLGYNAIQLMAIQEHPYYGSFGYHVSSFFAPSSRFGTPEELKHLIDTAHSLGLLVLLDLVHSHAVKNLNEGLNRFDGTDYHYFHAGARGRHEAWDSLLFDYSKYEVRRFLFSNCRYWLEEFRFDGFRFDGVTSMMYLDHGLGRDFTSYADYFGANIDRDALVYLQLANELIHTIQPQAVTVAEDVSGMVGIARPVRDGGLGFDYRLAMGIPDYWIKLLKEVPDEKWELDQIFGTLLNRRHGEKHIAYAESHDQALVGDKTIAFRLMDQEMYWNMANDRQSPVVDRGIALHKIIRLLTFSLGGEGWLNFMGNEFGHPEWVDFPREGNNDSYQHARRQWSLADNGLLRYQGLNHFDAALQQLDMRFNLLSDPFIEKLFVHESKKQLVYRRGPLVFVINLHGDQSYTDWRIPVPDASDYEVVLSTDAREFAGPGLTQVPMNYPWQPVATDDRQQSIRIYLPPRTAQVLAPRAR